MDLVAQASARAELEQDLVALRRHGVKHFAQTPSGFTVEFFPAVPVPEPEKPKGNDPDICACKHPMHAHMNGYCVEGCDAKLCEPGEKP
jgi:hypothetical protein